jgi:2-oxoglutarate dehydrogenase E2 component (dihydrolipoamide succinyltransferase)
MVTSLLHTAPHVTTVFEADFGAVLAHRERCREIYAARGAPLTLTAYVIAACVDGIRAVPETNARWTEDALEILERVDIGVGTALPSGALIVPVIRDVASLTLEEIARQLGDLTKRAREDRLTPAEVRGGTFTISNHGVSGSLLAAPVVINQPQSAILGVGKVERRPVVVDSDGEARVAIRPRCYLTLTIDHRVMDGQRANAFMDVLVRRLADWPADD